MSQQKANLADQRKAALTFLDMQGGVEKIRFTRDGSPSGLGAPWRVGAVVTIGQKDYRAILGLNQASSEPLPRISPQAASGPVTVIYSDGTSEVIG